jgi:hypothetical protein
LHRVFPLLCVIYPLMPPDVSLKSAFASAMGQHAQVRSAGYYINKQPKMQAQAPLATGP